MNLIYRQSNMFRINKDLLPPSAIKVEVINSLYIAIHKEFAGAINNKKYKNLTNMQKIEAINNFAWNWLKKGNFK